MFRISAALVICTALGACSSLWRGDPEGETADERRALKAARELDVIARDIEEYGSITASTGLPIVNVGEAFKFDLDLSPREILAMQGVQGQSAIRSFREFSAALSARTDVAKTPFLPNAPAPEGNVEVPTLPAAEPRATPNAFTAALAAANPDALDLSVRDLIKRVFDDSTTLKLLRYLSSPSADSVGRNYRIFAAALTVGIRPGRETYRGYAGEIDIRMEFGRECNDPKLGYEVARGVGHPLAFAAFPAIDSQTLDLRTSLRQQLALALALEAAAPQAAGALSAAFRRMQEQDAATLTSLNHVVGYNSGGRHFGWRFSPSFVAQADPSSIDTGPAIQLQPQSFPALALIMADDRDIGPTAEKREKAPPCSEVKTSQGRANRDYTHLWFYHSSRWLRSPDPSADTSWVPFSGPWNRFMRPRLSEEVVTDWGIRLERARKLIGPLDDMGLDNSGAPYAKRSLAKRLNALEAASVGNDTVLPLGTAAKEPPKAISAVSPAHGWIDAPTTFVVRGRGFVTGKMKFYVGGQLATAKQIGEREAVVEAASLPHSGKAPIHRADVTAVWDDGGSAVAKDAVTFDLAKPKDVAVATNRLVLEWEAGTDGQRKLKSMAVFGNPPAAEIIKALAGAEKTAISGTGTAKVEIEIKPDGAGKKN